VVALQESPPNVTINPPFVLFVGPTKSGTTWIHAYLESRGDIAVPSGMKETFFFDKVYQRGYDWYQGLFPPGDDTRLRVEVAPSLFHKPVACDRARIHLPHAKIVCIVRDPFDRAVSHYFHYRKRGAPKQSLASMADTYPDVIESGMYAAHARRWEQTFGHDRLHFLSYPLLCSDTAAFCQRLCEVLEIEYKAPDPSLRDRSVNAAKIPRNRLAARVAQSVAGRLRMSGASRVIKALKATPIKQWLYSDNEDFAQEKAEIRAQAPSLSDRLSVDWAEFSARADFPERCNMGV